jgi:N-methylhydantoinase B
MWYDWVNGGLGGRIGKDGMNAGPPVFGAGESLQPIEGQERLSPVLIEDHEILVDSGGPGEYRGGCGVRKSATLGDAEDTVMSYACDRARSVTWGMRGGLPSLPHGVWLTRNGETQFLGAVFSIAPLSSGDYFSRPSAGGGGLGDPLRRDPARVLDDVIDGYVSIERAERDYGVVVKAVDAARDLYEVDYDRTGLVRADIRQQRHKWLEQSPEQVAESYRDGEIGILDAVRRYGVVLDWGTGELLPRSTTQFRNMLARRSAEYWGEP